MCMEMYPELPNVDEIGHIAGQGVLGARFVLLVGTERSNVP